MNNSNLYYSASLVAVGTAIGVISCFAILTIFGENSSKKSSTKRRRRTHTNFNPNETESAESSLHRSDSIRRRSRRSGIYFGDLNEDTAQQLLEDLNLENGTSGNENNRRESFAHTIRDTNDLSQNASLRLDNGINDSNVDLQNLLSLNENELQNNLNEFENLSSSNEANNNTSQNNAFGSGIDSDILGDGNAQIVIDALESILNSSINSNESNDLESSNNHEPESMNSFHSELDSVDLDLINSNKLFSKEKLELESTSSVLELLLVLADTKNKRKNIVHRGVTCDGCNQYPVTGVRYKCTQCFDFDICEACEAKNVHKGHLFLKIKIPAPSMMNDHVPIMTNFYPGNMINAQVPNKEVSKFFYEAIKINTKFSTAEIYALYDEYCAFANYSVDGLNGINRKNFQKCLGVFGTKNSLLSDMMFNFYDANQNGVISFDEMVFGMGVLLRGSRSEKGKFFFRVFDLDGDGFLSLSEMKFILSNSFQFNQLYVQEMMSYMNDSIMIQPNEILPDQPISSAFTISIPPESTSVLDKEVSSLRRRLSELRHTNSNRLDSFDLTNPLETSSDNVNNATASSSRMAEFENIMNSPKTQTSLTNDNSDHSHYKNNQNNFEESESLEESFNNPEFSLFKSRDFINNVPTQQHMNFNNANSSNQTPLIDIRSQSTKTNADQKIEQGVSFKLNNFKEPSIDSLSEKNNINTSNSNNLNLQNNSLNLADDHSNVSDWPVIDLLIEDAVELISNDLFGKIKNRSSPNGLTINEFIELVNKDPRPLQWFEIIGPVF
ncbi:EF-hand calcium-binding domain-containing protein 1 [Smittium culicis]|uniref:EF-hand calcium-binding domain-containing protein 1 n=1 Tax=Smittium culicis TaxID=133412 RepID=A0A1R1YC34_9FUNG|nr:EF-hand calcium-binding domain-containing protein 1 [Smittium culicis]